MWRHLHNYSQRSVTHQTSESKNTDRPNRSEVRDNKCRDISDFELGFCFFTITNLSISSVHHLTRTNAPMYIAPTTVTTVLDWDFFYKRPTHGEHNWQSSQNAPSHFHLTMSCPVLAVKPNASTFGRAR